jgi:Macrocin-O-methyltransferase (TylF)
MPNEQFITSEQFKFPKQSQSIEKLSFWYSKLIDSRKEWLAQNMADQSYKDNQNNFSYSKAELELKKSIRKYFAPIPGSPYTKGNIEAIWNVELTPPERLKKFFEQSLAILLQANNSNIDSIDDYIVEYKEFGVFNGSSIASFVQALQNLGISQYQVRGFDSFEGLPVGSTDVDGGVWQDGFYSCTMDKTRKSLELKNIPIENIEFQKGWFENTLTPEFANEEIKAREDKQILSLFMVDCDTYPSSKTVFKYISMLKLDKPFILVLDDYRLFDTDLNHAGESQAFIEWAIVNQNLQITRIPSYNRKSEAFLVIPKVVI